MHVPTKRLPSNSNLDQLKRQAKVLVAEQRSGTLQACQRIREFHPKHAGAFDDSIKAATFTLSDAQLTIAREYGFASWARLGSVVRDGKAPGRRPESLQSAGCALAFDAVAPGRARGPCGRCPDACRAWRQAGHQGHLVGRHTGRLGGAWRACGHRRVPSSADITHGALTHTWHCARERLRPACAVRGS